MGIGDRELCSGRMSMRAAAWALSRPASIRSSSAASSETDDRISGSADIFGPMVVDIASSCELEKRPKRPGR